MIRSILGVLLKAIFLLHPLVNYVSFAFSDCALKLIFPSATYPNFFPTTTRNCSSILSIILSVIGFMTFILNFINSFLAGFFCYATGLFFLILCFQNLLLLLLNNNNNNPDPRQPFAVATFTFSQYMIVTNNIISLLTVLPNFMFLDTLAPLFSALSCWIGAALLFYAEPYFSYMFVLCFFFCFLETHLLLLQKKTKLWCNCKLFVVWKSNIVNLVLLEDYFHVHERYAVFC